MIRTNAILKLIAGIALAIVGTATILGARIYHFACQPQWTEMEAMRSLWLLYVIGFAVGVVGACMLERRP